MSASKSIVTTSSRWLPGILGVLCLLGATSHAFADPPKVVVLPFNGPAQSAKRATDAVAKALADDNAVVPLATWNATAQKLFATSRSAEDLAAVAKTLGIQVIVTGAIKRDPGWILVISIRQGTTGTSVEKQRYTLRGPVLPPTVTKAIPVDVPPLVAKVVADLAAPPPPEPEVAEKPLAEDTEAPLTAKPPPATLSQRPASAPWFDAHAGFLFNGRRFSYADPAQPQFRSTGAPGFRIDVSGYPVAFLARRSAQWAQAISGLGVGVTYDMPFWPNSRLNVPNSTETFATAERRLEVGLRWHWAIKPDRPTILANAQYGMHDFTIEKRPGGELAGPPDVAYRYVNLGAGTQIPVVPRVAILANLDFHIVVDSGEIHSVQGSGPGSTFGIRPSLGAEVRIWKGLFGRALGFYEWFGLSFAPNPQPAPEVPPGGGATDQYFGFAVTAGYRY